LALDLMLHLLVGEVDKVTLLSQRNRLPLTRNRAAPLA
jgi:hypothetical protein